MSNSDDKACPNKKRAFCKMAVVILAAVVVIAGLSQFVDSQALDELKHSMSVGTIIAIVIIINLVSLVCFILIFAAYQWVRGDLKPPRDEDLKD